MAKKHIPPPDGYQSWLDYAVDTFDTRTYRLRRMFDAEDPPSSEEIFDAARAELDELRAQLRSKGD